MEDAETKDSGKPNPIQIRIVLREYTVPFIDTEIHINHEDHFSHHKIILDDEILENNFSKTKPNHQIIAELKNQAFKHLIRESQVYKTDRAFRSYALLSTLSSCTVFIEVCYGQVIFNYKLIDKKTEFCIWHDTKVISELEIKETDLTKALDWLKSCLGNEEYEGFFIDILYIIETIKQLGLSL